MFALYERLEQEPRRVGRLIRRDDSGLEHFAYESPQRHRARLRVYYTIEAWIVSIEAIAIL